KWGFSADGDRFVTWSLDSGDVLHVTLYNLVGVTPNIPIWNGATPAGVGSAIVQFSPAGRYIFVSAITGGSQVYMTIANAVTGLRALEQTVTPSSAPTNGSVAGWGFGPGDFRFVYAYLNASNKAEVELVNLPNSNQRDLGGVDPDYSSGYWQFSPCGDVIAVVNGGGVGSPSASVTMYSTADATGLGSTNTAAPVSP